MILLTLFPLLLVQQVVPVGEEPRHHVVFENAYVRVIDAVVPPRDTTLFHTHDRDNVPVAISGGEMQTEVVGGGTTVSAIETGGVWFAPATYTHRITNTGPTPLRFIDAEILAAPAGAAGAPLLEGVPGLRLEIENEQVRVYRVRLGPGASTGRHTHAWPLLTVAVTAATVAVHSGGAETATRPLEAGDFEWHTAGAAHTVTNTGTTAGEVVEIEWKPRD